MKSAALAVVSLALLLPAGSVGAGQCTSEVENLAKVLAARDAGSGPTTGAPGSSTGQHPPTSAMSQADQGGIASGTAAQSNRPQHPPTAAMNREATGSTGSSGGVATQEQHPPTAVMNRESQAAASPGQGAPSQNMARATAELERARVYDQHGKEADCLSAVEQVKALMGSR
jgi:hypothetical protein